MDSYFLYLVFKFLHIATAVLWIGGGVTLAVLGALAQRQGSEERMLQAVESSALLGVRWFMPLSMLTLVFGIVATTLVGLWSEAWVTLGLLGFLATFLTGILILKPRSEAIDSAAKAGNRAVAILEARDLLRVAKFDYVVLFLVVADMVLKPAWSDWWFHLIAAIFVVAGWAAFMGIPGQSRPAATA